LISHSGLRPFPNIPQNKISGQEFSLKLGAPNSFSKPMKVGVSRLPWNADLSGKNNVEEKENDYKPTLLRPA
jgi:hypothetical protein